MNNFYNTNIISQEKAIGIWYECSKFIKNLTVFCFVGKLYLSNLSILPSVKVLREFYC